MKKDIRNHPYHFQQALQRQSTSGLTMTPTFEFNANTNNGFFYEHQQLKSKNSTYFTWLVFMCAKWVPFDGINQSKLEQSQQLGGTFVDIEDSNFPKVKRVRVFPKSNYLSYLGVKYRLSRVMQPDAWSDCHDLTPPLYTSPTQQHIMTRNLPPPTSTSYASSSPNASLKSSPHRSSQTLISHAIS